MVYGIYQNSSQSLAKSWRNSQSCTSRTGGTANPAPLVRKEWLRESSRLFLMTYGSVKCGGIGNLPERRCRVAKTLAHGRGLVMRKMLCGIWNLPEFLPVSRQELEVKKEWLREESTRMSLPLPSGSGTWSRNSASNFWLVWMMHFLKRQILFSMSLSGI